MNIVSIILLLSTTFSTVFSIKPKICVNCKYITHGTYSWQTNKDAEFSEYSRCSLFPKYSTNNKSNYLVTGIIEESITEYHYCSTARDQDSMCGEEGKEYKKRYTKKSEKKGPE